MEQHVYSLTEAQRQIGVEVVSVYNAGNASSPSVRVAACVNLSNVPRQVLRDFLFYTSSHKKLSQLSDNRNNVLHVHGDWSAFYLASKLLKSTLSPALMVASVHGKLFRPAYWYRRTLRQYGLVTATGMEEVRNLTNWLQRDVLHFPSAPNDDFFLDSPISASVCDVIAVGNLVPCKQTEILITCAKLRPALRFVVYGDGPELKRLEALRLQHRCNNLVFMGMASRDKIVAAMRVARVFVNVSRAEGTPTSMLEAMALGLPVIMTPSNDYSWILQQERNGLITNGWNPTEIVSAIDWCLNDEFRRQSISAANRLLSKSFTWKRRAELLTEHISNAMSANNRVTD